MAGAASGDVSAAGKSKASGSALRAQQLNVKRSGVAYRKTA